MNVVARVVLVVTVLAVAVLGLLPSRGGGYSCNGPPAARLVDPDVETGSTYFFDAGAACNEDARQRGWAIAATSVVGFGTSAGLALTARRRSPTGSAGGQSSGDEPVRSIW